MPVVLRLEDGGLFVTRPIAESIESCRRHLRSLISSVLKIGGERLMRGDPVRQKVVGGPSVGLFWKLDVRC